MAKNIMAHSNTKQFSRFIENETWHFPGTHQGKKLKDLPYSYLTWGLKTFRENGPQSQMIQMELSRRLDI